MININEYQTKTIPNYWLKFENLMIRTVGHGLKTMLLKNTAWKGLAHKGTSVTSLSVGQRHANVPHRWLPGSSLKYK